MIQNIRENIQGTLAAIIIAMISIPFVLTGMETFLSGGNNSDVGEINGEAITAQELNDAVSLQRRRLASQMGENIDYSQLDEDKLRGPALEALIDRKLLLQEATANNMAVSQTQINRTITGNAEFQEDGKFSQDLFQSLLQRSNFTSQQYKNLYAIDLLLNQYTSGFINTGFVTDRDLEINAFFMQQQRDIRYITLSLDEAKNNVSASEEEQQAFYEDNSELFFSDETVMVNYIELKKEDYITDISEAEIQAVYDQEAADFVLIEEREVAHILIELDDDMSKEQATELLQEIKTKLAAGENFADLASTYSDDLGSKTMGGALGVLNAEAFPESFVDAANALALNTVSDVVETDAGLHVIQLVGLSRNELPSFDSRKPQIEAELANAKAEPAYLLAVEELKDLSFNAPDLSEPASALDVDVKQSGIIKRAGGEGVFANPAVLSAVFSTLVFNERLNSEVIELTADHSIIVHLSKHQPRELLTFEAVKDKVLKQVIEEKSAQALLSSSEVVLQAVQQGADVEAYANEHGYTWQLQLAATRNAGGVDRALLDAAFELPQASETQRAVDRITLRNGDVVILTVNNVVDGASSETPGIEQQAIRNYMGRAKASEQFQTLQNYVKSQADIDILSMH